MSEEDQTVYIMALPKFDMSSHESNMSAKDVKSLALRHGVPLDLHPVALTKGWAMDKLSDDMIGLYEQRAIPNAMAWRHHDSDINDPVSEDGFSVQDVETLAERVIDLRLISSGLLFQGGLATTWDFPGFRHVFKDTEGNVVTMSEYLRFPFLSGTTIEKRNALTNQDLREQHIGKGKKASAARSDSSTTSGHVSSPEPIWVANLDGPNTETPSRAAVNIAESQENQSLYDSHHDSANHSGHEDQTIRNLTLVPTEVFQSSPDDHFVHRSSTAKRVTSPARLYVPGALVYEGKWFRDQAYYVPEWFIHRRCRVDNHIWCWELMIHLAPPAAQEESNALDNPTALEKAYLAETHTECGATVRQLLEAKKASQQSSRPYLEIFERELSSVNKDQALKIKELEDTLARKDSALVYVERINAEKAQESEKLVTQLSKTEMKKFDCVHKLLSNVVARLLQSHEYKQSLSEPFNLAIQAGWGKGLSEERSEEDLLELMSSMENFDVYVDKKMRVKYEKLFEK
nr:hypothetical protein [Tanacetum cinerariifolium]